MKRVLILLVIFVIFSIMLPIYAIEVDDEWYKKAIDTLANSDKYIAKLLDEIDSLTAELNATDVRLDYYRQKYNAQRGLYIGGNAAYPVGASGMAMIKFDQWGLYTIGGYQNGFYIGLGGIFKIGR